MPEPDSTRPMPFPIFLPTAPGLEPYLAEEAAGIGLPAPRPVPGGVTFTGGWPEVWRANLELRGASAVLARIASIPARSLGELDRGIRAIPWGEHLAWGVPVRVEVSTRKTRLQTRAAAPRIERAIRDGFGARIDAAAPVTVKVRIDGNTADISLDTSGEGLHKRGHKQWVGRAPMRETLAALLLRAAGYRGDCPVVDPMCGSGTFVIEAAEIAAGLQPGRDRSFAFEHLAGHDAAALSRLRRTGRRATDSRLRRIGPRCGRDRGRPRQRRPRRHRRSGAFRAARVNRCAAARTSTGLRQDSDRTPTGDSGG